MSERRSPFERLLGDLRHELRPLGRRARRRALDEARDHLLSAIEDAMSEGASRTDAEQRAVSRFGDVETIAARLCAARPRRRRVAPALLGAAAITGVLAFAAGPIADDIAPHRAAAAATVGPSEQGCATAFDSPSNAATRQLVPRANVLRVEIITTPVPSCVIKFQLAGQRVLTVQAPWMRNTAVGFRASIHTPGLVAGSNASWRNGRLTATGLYPDRPLPHGPGPTTATCVDAWNASPPTPPVRRQVSTPVVIRALNGGVSIISSSHASINVGFACTVWIAGPKGHATLVIGAWRLRGATRWRRPIGASGMLGPAIPNADLGTDGKLTLRRPAAPITTTAPHGAAPPKISHELGAAGWVGGVRLYSTLAQAVRHLGRPTDTIPTGLGCEMSWPGLHLSGLFMFGFVQHGKHRQLTPCGGTARVVSWTVTDTWRTDRGLRVGASDSEVARRYPGSTKVVSLAAGSTTWYLVPRHGGPSAMGLTAVSVGGLITQLTVTSGSTTFGSDVVSG